MKQSVFLIAILLVALTGYAGSYNQDFESAADGSTNLGDGSTISDSGSGLAQVYQYGASWKALRLTQDGLDGVAMVGNYLLPDLDAGTAITGFTATFNVLLKNNYNSAADGFSFNFGAIDTLPIGGEVENGIYSASAGPMLSIGWDTYAADGSGDYIWVYLNGSKIAGSSLYPTVSGSLSSPFQAVTVNWDENGLDLIYGGSTVFDNLNVSGFSASVGDQFAFSARTGGENQDVFIDDVNITTVPEPASALLLAGGLGVIQLIRRFYGK